MLSDGDLDVVCDVGVVCVNDVCDWANFKCVCVV